MSTEPLQLKAKMRALLERAAELRAEGHSWIAVGEKLGRSPETCRKWPKEYGAEWARIYFEAEAQSLAIAGSEAIIALRKLSRSEDQRWCFRASDKLASMRMRERDCERVANAGAAVAPTMSEKDRAMLKVLKQSQQLSDDELVDDMLRIIRAMGKLPPEGEPAATSAPMPNASTEDGFSSCCKRR